MSAVDLSRRALLLGGVAAALTACEDSSRPLGGPGARAPSATVSPGAADPDVQLAASALLVVRRAQHELERTVGRHRALRDALVPAVAVHQAHASLLTGAVPPGTDVGPGSGGRPPSPDARTALADAIALEERTGRALRDASLAARSGSFARVLGGMVAATAQQATLMRDARDALPRRRR